MTTQFDHKKVPNIKDTKVNVIIVKKLGEPTVVPEEFGEEETDQIAEQTEDEHDDEVVLSEMDNIQLIVAEVINF